jgi:ribosomal protein S12 methylthiotransferase
MQYYLISLGCPKNAVDAESIGALLDDAGFEAVFEPDLADVLLVNTCCFIGSARDESVQVLQELAAQKQADQWLLAVGCLAQRSGDALTKEVPGIDGVLGTRRWAEIVPILIRLDRRRDQDTPITLIGDSLAATPEQMHRTAIQGKSAYLKIADGCSAACAYCSIPLIKGPLHSRPADDIVTDARYLAERDVQEIILIAQDTTAYGRDRGQRDALPDLLDALVEAVPQVPWVRLMYAYPQHITPRLIETMARHPQICHYVDWPETPRSVTMWTCRCSTPTPIHCGACAGQPTPTGPGG